MSTLVITDGGRGAAGFRGKTGDCVVRAIAIATGRPYPEVYAALNELATRERPRLKKRSSARVGVQKPTAKRYMESIGWTWTPTMGIGSGCTVHLRADELPAGRLVVRVSRHMVAVIDGVIHDNHDCTRDGHRCVYGYLERAVIRLPLPAAMHIDRDRRRHQTSARHLLLAHWRQRITRTRKP